MNILKRFYVWSGTWPGTITIVLFIIFFVAQAFVIPSGSMKNTLLIGDMLFVKKFSYGLTVPRIPWIEQQIMPDFRGNGHLIEREGPKRGEIVVFRYPHDEKIHYVKRCVAVGGDIVFLQNKNLYIHFNEGNEYIKQNFKNFETKEFDDKLFVKNPYQIKHPGIHNDSNVNPGNTPHKQLFNFLPVKVPENEYFMMGDNRDHSNDSRFWGTVPYKFIVGSPWFVYFSWDENKKVRWDRMFKSPTALEKTRYTTQKASHNEGIY